MKQGAITRAKIEELLRFLPLFDRPGREFIKEWRGGETVAPNTVTMHHPVYCDDVVEFFGLLAQDCWSDYGYKPAQAREMLEDEAFIAAASPDEIKTLLTYCVRAERFADGAWGALLGSGKIVALLRRLDALKDSIR